MSPRTTRRVASWLARSPEVTEEYENLRINTAISKLIVLNNHLTSLGAVPRDAIEPLILMLAPVAPHLCEELWSRLGHEASLAREPFPVVEDSSLLEEDTVTAVIQVNGKVKARIEVAPSISEEDSSRPPWPRPDRQGPRRGRSPQGDRPRAEAGQRRRQEVRSHA